MAIDKFNAEGYYDPVVFEALTKIEKEERAARKAALSDLWCMCAVHMPGILIKTQLTQGCIPVLL
nr:hypothetical protein [Lachnoclostridium phytofermentans]